MDRRLAIVSSWPLFVLLAANGACVGWEVVRECINLRLHVARPRYCAAAFRGVQRTLPLTLVLTFILVPSTATQIFKTFQCDGYQFDSSGATRRYVRDDPSLSCNSDEYKRTEFIAFVMVTIWPVGVPALYALLLFASRDAIRTGVHTPLSRATAFLWADYDRSAYLWEPLEMCRKLTLTGERAGPVS